jgi:hypothetical protein
MKILRTLLAAFLVLSLGVAAPAQAGDNSRRIEVTGEAMTLSPSQGDSCFAGGDGFVSQTQYVGVVEPLGELDPTGSTAEYCTVLKQLGTTPFGETGARQGWRHCPDRGRRFREPDLLDDREAQVQRQARGPGP